MISTQLYLDHLAERGRDLFRVACERDLEGIVAKWAHGTYHTDGRSTSWLKIKNPHYTQMRDRHELFSTRQLEGSRRRGAASRPELRLRRPQHTGPGALAVWFFMVRARPRLIGVLLADPRVAGKVVNPHRGAASLS